MKKLTFLNGSLLIAILAGAAIITEYHDGYDHHVIIKMPPTEKDGKPVKPEYAYEIHTTKNYEPGSNEFIKSKSDDRNLRVIKGEFEHDTAKEAEFKAKYPREIKPTDEGLPA